MCLKAICEGRRITVLVFALMSTMSSPAGADIGSNGKVKSPYVQDRAVLAEEVARIKSISAHTRLLRDVAIQGTHSPGGGRDVGLMYVTGNRVAGDPLFAFTGTTEDGKPASVDFSEVESFWVVPRDDAAPGGGKLLVEIVQFPLITPEELVQRQPSYSELFDHNRKTLRLWLNTQATPNKTLCLVGKDETRQYRIIARASNLTQNTKITFDYGTFAFGQINLPAIWWAIPSVTRDSNYPYRTIVKS